MLIRLRVRPPVLQNLWRWAAAVGPGGPGTEQGPPDAELGRALGQRVARSGLAGTRVLANITP